MLMILSIYFKQANEIDFLHAILDAITERMNMYTQEKPIESISFHAFSRVTHLSR